MSNTFILFFCLPFIAAFLLTPLVRKLAFQLGLLDEPNEPRKIQSAPVPLFGGLAVYAALLFGVVAVLVISPGAFGDHIKPQYLAGILIGGAILMVGGFLDDKFRLPPKLSIVAPVVAVLVVIVSGVQLSYVNSPLGGALLLDKWKMFGYPLLGGAFIFVWILGMIYTTKFLDGMDGLVAGVSGIGALVIFFLSQIAVVNQSDTALLAVIFTGAILGFLPWNFHPARIFLGEGGSTLAGFMIGVLAVISGGKIATALLVMGIPILDAAWVILRRIINHFSPFQADRKHLHFRLLDIGLSQRKTVIFLYSLSAAFGLSALYLQALGKLVALLVLLATMVLLGGFLVVFYKRKNSN